MLFYYWLLSFIKFDQEITLSLSRKIYDLLNPIAGQKLQIEIFSFFSFLGNSAFIWILIVVLLFIFEERKNPGISKRDIAFVTTFILCVLTAIITSQIIVKNLVKRPRPCSLNFRWTFYLPGQRETNCPKDFSFPSSHATIAFAAATIISVFDKKRRWAYLTIAMLISISRIYLGYHYFFDVTMGAFLGWIISIVILSLSKKSIKHR